MRTFELENGQVIVGSENLNFRKCKDADKQWFNLENAPEITV